VLLNQVVGSLGGRGRPFADPLIAQRARLRDIGTDLVHAPDLVHLRRLPRGHTGGHTGPGTSFVLTLLCRSERWRGAESNCRHRDFQSRALPTELPRRAAPENNNGTLFVSLPRHSPQWSSLECSSPCQGEGRRFKSGLGRLTLCRLPTRSSLSFWMSSHLYGEPLRQP